MAAKDVNAPDVGDGARMFIAESEGGQGPLEAMVNLKGKVVKVTANYGPEVGSVEQPRPQDRKMIQTIAKAVGE